MSEGLVWLPDPQLQAGRGDLMEDAGGAQDGAAPLAPWQLAGGWSFLCRQRPQAPPVSPQSQASWPECWDQTLVMCLRVPGS